MRKTSVRKFIHMVIDILPLLIIPIFALNILHKETEPISIEVQERESVNFNQIVKNGNFEDNTIWSGTSAQYGTFTISNNVLTMTCSQDFDKGLNWGVYQVTNNKLKSYHKYYVSLDFEFYTTSTSGAVYVFLGDYSPRFDETAVPSRFEFPCNNSLSTYSAHGITYGTNVSTQQLSVWTDGSARLKQGDYFKISNFNIFDLTFMYGEGNEPTMSQFRQSFNEVYYQYTESQKMLVNKPTTTTYNNTDIGSQFVYALYKPVHDYFNFNNLFNMGAIYNWIELNLFSGTAPLPIFIIWNVIVYEFFVDLIFLLYGVFMFIIDFAEKCLERPFRR